jgi:Uma2 family endonuclease
MTMNLDFELMLQADALGLRLEITAGRHTWESQPMLVHQKAIDRIRASIRPIYNQNNSCDCPHYADVYIRFPDGSLKRPDISVFCHEPSEQRTPITLVPEAVIEVISEGYELKDLEINPSFYLSQGVKDVVVLDPTSNFVLHARRDSRKNLQSPVQLMLECGCEVVV